MHTHFPIPKNRKMVVMETTQSGLHPSINGVLDARPDVRKTLIPHLDPDSLVITSRKISRPCWRDKMVNRTLPIQLLLAWWLQSGAAAAGRWADDCGSEIRCRRLCSLMEFWLLVSVCLEAEPLMFDVDFKLVTVTVVAAELTKIRINGKVFWRITMGGRMNKENRKVVSLQSVQNVTENCDSRIFKATVHIGINQTLLFKQRK